MKVDVEKGSQPLELLYLLQIEMLTLEIKAGMDAIGANSLSTFGASVAKQQEIVENLCRIAGQLHVEQQPEGSQGLLRARREHTVDHMVDGRIRLAGESLRRVKLGYAALLKHCEESASIFTGLCRSYTGQYEGPNVTGRSRHDWSS